MIGNYNSLSESKITLFKNSDRINVTPSTKENNNLLTTILIVVGLFFVGFSASAQNVAVLGADATTNAASPFATLSAAFASINATAQTGNTIAITIVGNTSEPVTGAILNAGLWTSMSIQPSGGVARTITGAATAALPLIDFNGADNVTVNGLNTGGNSLTIANTTVAATSGTSTIRFQTDATSNTITNCNLQGSATMAVGTNGGVVWFGSAAVTTGSDNNTISFCNIGPAGSNLPTKGIYFSGSSNTDPGTANSGIVINGNNIFDYFGASVASAGIDLNSGTTGTVISNNKFYQTATRTQVTTGSTHSGIRISNTSGNGYQITGNTIGFASATGTGTYAFVGISASSIFIPINLSVGTTTATSVQGNTVKAISMSGAMSGVSSSGAFRGIYVGSGLTTVGDVTGNTIGDMATTGSITFTSSSASASDVIGIFNFGGSNWTTNNNNVGGISASNSSTGAANVYGIRCNTGSAVTWSCLNNTIGGNIAASISTSSTATGTIVNGILNSNPIGTFTGNIIRNLTTAGGTGTTTTASMVGICITSSTPSHTVSQNTIYNLSNTNATAASTVTGVQFTGATSNVVERNFIYGLTNATNSATAELNGIRVAGGTTIYRNNMIALGTGVTNAFGTAATNSSTSGINGFNGFLGTDSFFHNTIYIGGTPTTGAGPSYAFNGTQTVNVRSFRDNIFVNNRTNSGTATGTHYIIKMNGTVVNPTGLTLNNNVYFGAGAVFGFYNSLDVANIGAWKTAVGQDANSFQSNPQLLDPTNALPDLHINASISSVAEGNGADVGVTLDYDGQTRSGLTPVDIGADAGNFMGVDLSAPVITYTALLNTSSTANRTIAVTITDATGVDPTVFIYYNKNAGVYFRTTATLTSGSPTNGVWTCTIDNTLIGGVVATDVIRYYVVAQDTLGNIAANPSPGFSGTLFSNTPPTTPNSYIISTTYTGVINVGSTETITSLTNAGGLFELINNGALTGNVTVNITSDLAGELGTNALNQWSEDGAGNYTMTIKPSSTPRSITGSSASGLIRFNGTDRVTLDGSLAATANTVCPVSAASRDLTITNTNTGSSSAVVWLQTAAGSNSATNNTVKNCNLVGNSNTTTLFGVGSGSSTIGTSSLGTGNNNNSFVNNNISKTQIGIYSQGAAIGNKNTGTVINQNVINSASPNNVQIGGIRVGFESGIVISGNNIANMNGGVTTYGIALGLVPSNTYTTLTGNEVEGAVVTKNVIDNIVRNGDGTAIGIALAQCTSASPATNLIANNMISNVRTTTATPSDSPFGIEIGGGTGATNVYYNTVYMSGAASSSSHTFALAVGGSNPVIDIRNNIFVNKQTSTSGKMYGMVFAYSTFTNLTSNNNNFFVTADANHFDIGTSGFAAPAGVSRASWNSSNPTKDSASQGIDPVFTSTVTPANLHLVAADATNLSLNNGGVAVSVTDDIDCDSRANDIGADEFTPPVCANAVGGTASGNIAGCGSVTSPTITATGYSSGTVSTYQWMFSTTFGDYPNLGTAVGGQTNPATLTTGPIATTTYYWLRVTCNSGIAVDNSTLVTITINPSIASISGPSSKCAADPAVTFTENGGTGISWLWSPGGETTQSISVSAAGTYTVQVTSPGSCVTSISKTFIVYPNPTGVLATSSAANACTGVPFDLFATSDPISGGISENFDSVTAPLLPLNWTSAIAGVGADMTQWTTSTSSPISGTNSLFVNDAATNNDKILTSPAIPIISASAVLTFNHNYTFEGATTFFDGGVLEISIGTGPFVDITVGGSFASNGYNGVISSGFGSLIGGRNAFCNTSSGTKLVTVNLPAAAAGQSIRLRWRMVSDNSLGSTGWKMDDIIISDSVTPTYSWTSVPAGFSSSLQNPTGVTQSVPRAYNVIVTGAGGCTTESTINVGQAGCASIVNLKLFIEGYYDGGAMRPVKNNQDGSSPLDEVENITVELHNATTYALVYTTIATLKTNGAADCSFPGTANGSYYIVVKSSNAVQTWSATPQTVGAVPLDYDFTTAANKAYEDNMIDVGGAFGFYSGDINQDDVIDGSDSPDLDLDIFNSEFGVRVTDLNGDGTVDGSDATYLENNSFNSIFAHYPQ